MIRATAFPALAALFLGACSNESGFHPTAPVYNTAKTTTEITQIAYANENDRLRNLAIDFAAETTDTVNFGFDRATLDGEARRALDGQARWIRDHPEVRFFVIGHTDLVGSEQYNDGLGLRRARAVVAYLVDRGVEADRLEALESRGELEPIVPTETRERRNRRAVTMVAGFARNFVGDGMDGQRAVLIYEGYRDASGPTEVSEADSAE